MVSTTIVFIPGVRPKPALKAPTSKEYICGRTAFWGWMGKDNTRLISYLREEGLRIQQEYGHHASFVMFALGNELSGDFEVMQSLVNTFRQADRGICMLTVPIITWVSKGSFRVRTIW